MYTFSVLTINGKTYTRNFRYYALKELFGNSSILSKTQTKMEQFSGLNINGKRYNRIFRYYALKLLFGNVS